MANCAIKLTLVNIWAGQVFFKLTVFRMPSYQHKAFNFFGKDVENIRFIVSLLDSFND